MFAGFFPAEEKSSQRFGIPIHDRTRVVVVRVREAIPYYRWRLLGRGD